MVAIIGTTDPLAPLTTQNPLQGGFFGVLWSRVVMVTRRDLGLLAQLAPRPALPAPGPLRGVSCPERTGLIWRVPSVLFQRTKPRHVRI